MVDDRDRPRITPHIVLVVLCSIIAALGLLWVLRAAFAGQLVIQSNVFTLGLFHVRWYGLLIALAVLIGLPWTLERLRRERAGNHAKFELALWWAVGGGLIGARLVFVAQNWLAYSIQPLSILNVHDGGLSIHGMLLGGVVVGAFAARALRVSFGHLADASVPAILFGMIVGRFGNFTNAELIGYPTDLPWKMFVLPTHRPFGYETDVFFHPIFLYDAILNALLFLALVVLVHRTSYIFRFRGERFLLFLIGIAITRFVVEFWRINIPDSSGGLSSAQLVSIGLGLLSFCLLVFGRYNSRSERIR